MTLPIAQNIRALCSVKCSVFRSLNTLTVLNFLEGKLLFSLRVSGTQISQKSRSYLQILRATNVAWWRIYNKNSQILGATVQSFVVRTTFRLGFLQTWPIVWIVNYVEIRVHGLTWPILSPFKRKKWEQLSYCKNHKHQSEFQNATSHIRSRHYEHPKELFSTTVIVVG